MDVDEGSDNGSVISIRGSIFPQRMKRSYNFLYLLRIVHNVNSMLFYDLMIWLDTLKTSFNERSFLASCLLLTTEIINALYLTKIVYFKH